MSEWSLPTDTKKVSIEKSGGFLWDSGVYPVKVKLAYLDQAKSGATSFNIILENNEGKELKNTMYIRSGKAKKNSTTYTKDGVKYPLPGYSTAESLCRAATGKNLEQNIMAHEKKQVKIYDFEQQKDVVQERPVLVNLLGASVQVAVSRIKENKSKKNADGDYVDTDDIREINECKFFGNADGFSADEISENIPEAKALPSWHKVNAGKVIDKSKTAVGTGANSAAGIMGTTPAAAPAASLF
ncbi:MAG: hypothetical protein U9O94_06325 [Nanoarchaeota archaeon]|nr:hypothetical protein [Nanoarchaeota archaeon]